MIRRRNYHTKSSQTEEDKYPMILLTCGIQSNDAKQLIYKRETNSQILKSNLGLPKGKARWGGVN